MQNELTRAGKTQYFSGLSRMLGPPAGGESAGEGGSRAD